MESQPQNPENFHPCIKVFMFFFISGIKAWVEIKRWTDKTERNLHTYIYYAKAGATKIPLTVAVVIK